METGKNTFYARLNAMLRGKKSSEDDMLKKYSDIISKAINRHRLGFDAVCYRGTNHDMSEGINEGDTFLNQDFVSTSIVRKGMFRRRYEIIIHIPKGTRAGYIEKISWFPKQYELLLDKNTLFKVISRKGRTIELEVVDYE